MPRDKSTHPVLKEVKCASSARAECYALVDPFIITLDHERFVWPTFCGVIFRGCVSGRHPKEQERKQLRIARFGGWETCIRRPSSAREGAHRLGSDALSARSAVVMILFWCFGRCITIAERRQAVLNKIQIISRQITQTKFEQKHCRSILTARLLT